MSEHQVERVIAAIEAFQAIREPLGSLIDWEYVLATWTSHMEGDVEE